MAKREKLAPPAWFLEAVERERATRKLSWRALARAAKVSASSLVRMRAGEASWDTLVKVARALGLPPPSLIDPLSAGGILEGMRDTNPQMYEIFSRMLRRSGGDTPWPDGSR